jgi:hypothetical protein
MRPALTVLACTGLLLAGAARAENPPGDTPGDTTGATPPEAIDKLVLPTPPVACAFTAQTVPTSFTLELRPGVAYATINRVDAIEVKLPAARKPAPLVVKLTAQDVKLEGVVDAAALPLYAARPFVAGELFVPGPAVPIAWTAAKAGQVDVSMEIDATTKGAIAGVTGPLRATRPCADLGVDHAAEFDRFRAVGARSAEGRHTFAGDAPISIAAKPGGRTPAQLLPPSSSSNLLANIVVIQKKKPWARIGYDTMDFLIVGWVREGDLRPLPPADLIGEAFGAGGLGQVGSGEGHGTRGTFTCKQAVPLIAEVGVERLIVGSVGAGVGMSVDTTAGDLLPVRLVNFVSFEAAAGAQFFVRYSDVEHCPGFAAPGKKRGR